KRERLSEQQLAEEELRLRLEKRDRESWTSFKPWFEEAAFVVLAVLYSNVFRSSFVSVGTMRVLCLAVRLYLCRLGACRVMLALD
uniref:Transmembrane protein n=1 Tax=Mesocestoides corti TaxID=53468 RepID=A0A5K3G282_MESCO